jgi:hypothetical protein
VGSPAILFFESEYDERRARGLAAMSGVTVSVADAAVGVRKADVLEVLREPAEPPTYPDAPALVAAVRRLGIVRQTAPSNGELIPRERVLEVS